MEYRLARTKSHLLGAMMLAALLRPGQLAPAFCLRLSKDTLWVRQGSSKKLRALLKARYGDMDSEPIPGKSLLWHSSDSSIARVGKKGRVYGRRRGHCVVSARTVNGALMAVCHVEVRRKK